jgi:hypothetical protein
VRILIRQTRGVVSVGAKSDYALFVKVKFHGGHLVDEHVNAHVPLGASDEKRVGDVLLHDRLRVIL